MTCFMCNLSRNSAARWCLLFISVRWTCHATVKDDNYESHIGVNAGGILISE